MIVEIHFTTCNLVTITKTNNELFYQLDWDSGLQEFMTENTINGLFTISQNDSCNVMIRIDIVKEDGTDFANTDPIYSLLDLANRDYKSLKFNTNEPQLPGNMVY